MVSNDTYGNTVVGAIDNIHNWSNDAIDNLTDYSYGHGHERRSAQWWLQRLFPLVEELKQIVGQQYAPKPLVPPTRSFAEAYPNERGQKAWCMWCGETMSTETLNEYQECPECAQWWLDNPPPGEDNKDPINEEGDEERIGRKLIFKAVEQRGWQVVEIYYHPMRLEQWEIEVAPRAAPMVHHPISGLDLADLMVGIGKLGDLTKS